MNFLRTLILALLTLGQATIAVADAPLIWNGIDAALLNNFPGGLKGKDGTIYPKNYLGPKNYAALGSSRPTGWGGSGTATVAQATNPVVIPEPNIGTGIFISPGAATNFVFYNWKIDPSDSTVQQKLTWAQQPNGGYASGNSKLEIYSCTVAWSGTPATTCSGTTTRIPLTTDSAGVTSIPATQNLATNFAAPAYATAPFMQLRIVTVTATGTLTLSSVYTGPGSTVQGGNIGPWLAYTPTLVGFGTATAAVFYWRQIGDSVEIEGSFNAGTPNTSAASFTLPNSYTYPALNPSLLTAVGNYNGNQTGATGTISANNASDSVLYFSNNGSGNSRNNGNSVTNSVAGATVTLYAKIQVNQLIGSGTVNLAQNDLQYYYGTGGTWGTPGTLTTAQGPGGVAGGNTTPSGNVFTYVITPVTKIPVGTTVTFESSPDQINWSKGTNPQLPSGTLEALRYDGTNFIGANAVLSSSGNINVSFGKYANGATSPYSSLGTWYWRVTVGLPGQAVGFAAYVPGQSAGLVPAVGLPGSTNGVAPCSGCVGQEIISNFTGTSFPASGTRGDLTTITLPAGVFDVSANVEFNRNGATIAGNLVYISIITASGNSGTGEMTGWNTAYYDFNGNILNTNGLPLVIPPVRALCDGTNITIAGTTTAGTTLRLKGIISTYSVATPNASGILRAMRVQ